MYRALLVCLLLVSTAAQSQSINGDVNCDNMINISDAVFLVSYIFLGGQAPCQIVQPGIAYAQLDTMIQNCPYNTWVSALQLTIQAPSDGYLQLTCNGRYLADNVFSIGLDTVEAGGSLVSYQMNQGWNQTRETVPLSEVLQVKEGLHHIFLAVRSDAMGSFSMTIIKARLSALFVPVNYGK